MQLTSLGADQHYRLGQYVRDRYFNSSNMTSMKQAGVYAQSTYKDRTMQSATSQLQGLFEAELTFPSLDPSQFPLITQVNEDKLILTDGDNCERMD